MPPFKNEQNETDVKYTNHNSWTYKLSSAFDKEGDWLWVTVDKIQENFVKRLLRLFR